MILIEKGLTCWLRDLHAVLIRYMKGHIPDLGSQPPVSPWVNYTKQTHNDIRVKYKILFRDMFLLPWYY